MWIALLELETPFTHEIIDLSDKPSEFLRLSGAAGNGAKVPLLEMGEQVVGESLDIVRLLGKDTSLLPAQGESHIEPVIELWVGQVEPAYYALLRASSEPEAQRLRLPLLQALSDLENRLLMRQGFGGPDDTATFGPFLCDDFSLAEVVAAPWVERMLQMMPLWRAVDFPYLLQQNGLERTRTWMQAIAARPSVTASSAGADEMERASRRYYVKHVSPGAPGVL